MHLTNSAFEARDLQVKMSNNTVLITGGGSGIGLELARMLARQGNWVLICGRNPEKLERAQREIEGLEIRACDLALARDRETLSAWVLDRFADLNILVNNAGIAQQLDLTGDQFSLEAIARELATDLQAPVDLTLRLLPHLRRQKQAAIINVTTGLVYSPDASTPIYSSAKAGLHAWTGALRFQLRRSGIKVFEVLPPIVATEMIKGLGIEIKDAVPPAQVAEAIVKGVAEDVSEIRVGATKSLYVMTRIAPHLMYQSVNQRITKMREQSKRRIPKAA
jgi:uncharacterized oxidoreductase